MLIHVHLNSTRPFRSILSESLFLTREESRLFYENVPKFKYGAKRSWSLHEPILRRSGPYHKAQKLLTLQVFSIAITNAG